MYSELDLISKKESIDDSTNVVQFFYRWFRGFGGTGTLCICVPKETKQQLDDICQTIRDISGLPFQVSHFSSLQIEELLQKNKVTQNLYAVKKGLMKIEDIPAIHEKTMKKGRKSLIRIRISKKLIFQMELLLSRMEDEFGKHEYTVEKVIELLIFFSLRELNTGKAQNLISSILQYLGVEKWEVQEFLEERELLLEK